MPHQTIAEFLLVLKALSLVLRSNLARAICNYNHESLFIFIECFYYFYREELCLSFLSAHCEHPVVAKTLTLLHQQLEAEAVV